MLFRLITLYAVLLTWLPFTAAAAPAIPKPVLQTAAQLRNKALKDGKAYDIVRSLTTEVGPRLAGSSGDQAAVAWALTMFKSLGFRNVHTETVMVPHWVRGNAEASITQPYPQHLAVTALGGSVGTSEDGIEAPVVEVDSLNALAALQVSDVEGKIVFFNVKMQRTRDGSGYSKAVVVRENGPVAAARKGAIAVVIRSIGTDNNRLAHTGITEYDPAVRRIPAVAISNPDADTLQTELAQGVPVSVQLRLTCRFLPAVASANVIGDIPGTAKPAEYVLLGAHLDSWDLGTGAIDDGAGVAIVMEAARMIGRLHRHPRRTIRVVLFANEEFGLSGAKDYAKRHAGELGQYALAVEPDLGADRVWQMNIAAAPSAHDLIAAIAKALQPLDIAFNPEMSAKGSDVKPLMTAGVPVASLLQDTNRYFDYHHTANDTLDKIDPAQLRQNVAAYVTLAFIAAAVKSDFGRLPAANPPTKVLSPNKATEQTGNGS